MQQWEDGLARRGRAPRTLVSRSARSAATTGGLRRLVPRWRDHGLPKRTW